jgi:hypothetical protein
MPSLRSCQNFSIDVSRCGVEAPCSKLQGVFEVQGSKEAQFPLCSLTPQQAAWNALAMHFQDCVYHPFDQGAHHE